MITRADPITVRGSPRRSLETGTEPTTAAPRSCAKSARSRGSTVTSASSKNSTWDAFERGTWGQKCPTVVATWRRAWAQVIPFFAFPPDVRRLIYTTNALESVHGQLRKIIKTRGQFPNDDAATTLMWLALRNITAKWARTSPHWRAAMNQFAILYEDRFSPTTT